MKLFIPSPVFVSEAGSVGSDSELAKKLTEPSLDVDPFQSTFVHHCSLSTSKVFAIVNSGVVKSRHNEVSCGEV